MKKLYTIINIILLLQTAVLGQLSGYQRDTILSAHNFYRSVVGSPPLEWSDELSRKAQDFANQIVSNPLLTHNTYGYGQNLYYTRDTSRIVNAVHYWSREQIYYYGQVINDSNLIYFRHYTNIIWKDTRRIGCGLARLKSGIYVLVCFYDPKGNVPGERAVR